ncbi:YidC/Oxa1 family membrane protein insertase [Weissella uvarum]|uniref:membrane protein insertase YidC n=1 Tax=Weissella uvarum TaxID=1479233 RepID=UPI001960CA23|nr:membrane protein insertase YidC [Weissella uvarum]MBM7617467.1 YidC/Oxa1 family membrane protein insertase [Weissella uvarum]MCM0595648.1 membrane protein insertase YidC [Weissella uvarum]
MKLKSLTPILFIILIGLLVTGNIGILQGPLTQFMEWAGNVIGGPNAVGWSIIVLTLMVRLLLMPFMVQQQHAATVQQEKMILLQPQLNKVQEAQKNATTQEEQMRASQAMMAIYRENGVSMLGGVNFSVMIIQMPIFTGLYQAIQHSPELAQASFYGISLSDKSPLLAIFTAFVYFLQSYLSMIGMPEDQKKSMRSMMFIMPLMMLFTTWFTNGGIALYFSVGAIVMILQQLIITMWRPRIRRHVADTFEVKDVVDDALAGTLESSAEPQSAFAKAMQNAQEELEAEQQQEATGKKPVKKTEAQIREENRLRNQKKHQGDKQ